MYRLGAVCCVGELWDAVMGFAVMCMHCSWICGGVDVLWLIFQLAACTVVDVLVVRVHCGWRFSGVVRAVVLWLVGWMHCG
jgi:hypothetical protein